MGYDLDDFSLVQESEMREHHYYSNAKAQEFGAEENELIGGVYEPDVTAASAFNEVDNMVDEFAYPNGIQSLGQIRTSRHHNKK